MQEYGIKWGSKTLLDLGCSDDLSILNGNVGKMNDFFEILRVQRARISLKINLKKNNSLGLGINKGDEVMMSNEEIDQVDSIAYQVVLSVKGVDAVKQRVLDKKKEERNRIDFFFRSTKRKQKPV